MTRLERVKEQITATKTKIADLTERLRGLERQKTELENGDILKMIHGFNVSKDEILLILQNREKDGAGYNDAQTASFRTDFKKEEKD